MYVKALKEGFQRYNWLSAYQKWRRLDNNDTVGVAFTRGLKQREMFISGTDSKGNAHQWDKHKGKCPSVGQAQVPVPRKGLSVNK